MTGIISKFAFYIIVALVSAIATLGVNKKFFSKKEVTIDYERIADIVSAELAQMPEPTVSVQPFDVEKIKGVKHFEYKPEFTGSISVAGVDSTAIRKMIDASVDRAFQKYMLNDKKKRR